MSKYIEFIGVPGVGKSTTFNYLKKIQNEKHNYRVNGENYFNLKSFLFLIKFLKNSARFSLGQHPATFNYDKALINRFLQSNEELVELFWQNVACMKSYNSMDLRFNKVQYILKIFAKIQSLKEMELNKVCIVDEGLIHSLKNFIISASPLTYEQQLLKVLDLFDLPLGVVIFEGDAEVIVDRTLRREKTRATDKINKTELIITRKESIKERQKWKEALVKKNIPIVCLDAEEGVKQKAEKIISFVNFVQDRKPFPSNNVIYEF